MKPKSTHKRIRPQNIHLGFQIAPMVDVVFVILLFFVVAAGTTPKEKSLNTVLPSICAATPLNPPDPVDLMIDEAGQVYLNEEPLDSPDSRELPELSQAVRELRNAGYETQTGSDLILTTASLTKYQRVVDVLDVLAREKISNVTFQAGSDE